MTAAARHPSSAPASKRPAPSLPPWWAFALALVAFGIVWFTIPRGHLWLGLVIVLGALWVTRQQSLAAGTPSPLGFLPGGG